MKDFVIKPIPKYIEKIIYKKDQIDNPYQTGNVRFYAYLTKIQNSLCKVTVAVKNRYGKWYCKQVAVHEIHSKHCLVKDMCFYHIGGYVVGWHDIGLTKEQKWFEDGKWDYADDKYFDPWCEVVNLEYALKKYPYSAIDIYGTQRPLQYLRLYEKYPQAEYLIKLGLSRYAMYKTILGKIGKDKNFAKWLIKHKQELTENYVNVPVILQAYKRNVDIVEMQALFDAKNRFAKDASQDLKLLIGSRVEQFINYIGKQKTSIANYNDYLNACNNLGLDMTEEKNKYPHDFQRWHDIRIDEYHSQKAKNDEIERKELYDKFFTVAEKYSELERNKGIYAVVIAKSPADLIHEGDVLNHCVGRMGYDQKFAREETLIFFVRQLNDLNTPYVTLEYSLTSHKVLQCYGEHDSTPQDDVMKFVKKTWLPYANKKIKTIQAVA